MQVAVWASAALIAVLLVPTWAGAVPDSDDPLQTSIVPCSSSLSCRDLCLWHSRQGLMSLLQAACRVAQADQRHDQSHVAPQVPSQLTWDYPSCLQAVHHHLLSRRPPPQLLALEQCLRLALGAHQRLDLERLWSLAQGVPQLGPTLGEGPNQRGRLRTLAPMSQT